MSTPDPDLLLVRRVATRDADALEALYDRHTGLLYPVALRIVRSPADAEDVLQQTWVKVWDSAATYDAARGSVAGWLLAIVRSRALDLYRSRATRRNAESAFPSGPTPVAPDPSASAAERQRRDQVRLALQRLDPHYRQVLEIAYFEGRTQIEIAERLETPLGTIKTWTRRGLLKLKELLPEGLGT
jgi:RNA polymerase sigma-70 factor, ECF subfamily